MIKKVLVAFAASVLSLMLFSLAISRSLSSNIDASHVKRWLATNNLYADLVPAALEQSKQDTTINTDTTSVPLSDPGVQKAVEKAFPASLLQSSSETAIDSLFKWLNGTAAKPDFRIDFSGAKKDLATNLANYIKTRYAQLPACAKGQLPNSSDVFAINCRPAAGFDINAAAQNATNDIATSKDFLPNPVVTESNFSTSSTDTQNQKPLSERYPKLPRRYQTLKRAPMIAAALAIFFALIVFFLSVTKRRGLRHIASVLLTVGVVVLLVSIGMRSVLSRAERKVFQGKPATAQLTVQKDLFGMAKGIAHDVTSQAETVSLGYILLGGGTLVALFFTRKKGSGQSLPIS